jgi:hypothetical protein
MRLLVHAGPMTPAARCLCSSTLDWYVCMRSSARPRVYVRPRVYARPCSHAELVASAYALDPGGAMCLLVYAGLVCLCACGRAPFRAYAQASVPVWACIRVPLYIASI